MSRGLVLACILLLDPGALTAQCGEQLLKAYNGQSYDDFGEAVALSGPLAVVGAPGQAAGGSSVAGAAYLFQDLGTADGYAAIGEISPYGSALGLFAYTSRYGADVAVDGDLVAVGAPGTALVPGDVRGAVFLWQHNGITWSVAEMLVSATPGQKEFGETIALSGDTLVTSTYDDSVGAGTLRQVQVFERVGGVWTNTAVIADPTGLNTGFGSRLAIDGDRIVAGAPNLGSPSPTKGAVYVIDRDAGGGWSIAATLAQPEPTGSYSFGESVAVSGDRIAVGNLSLGDGHAVTYRRVGGSWVHEQTLSQPGDAAWLGGSVAIGPGRLAVGSTGGGGCFSSYWDDGGWTDLLEMYPAQQVPVSSFGEDVAIDGNRLFVGDPTWKEGSGASLVEPGAAFLLELPENEGFLVEVLAGLRHADGTLLVDELIGNIEAAPVGGETIHGAFTFEPAWAQLDACYDFRWVSVLVEEHAGGELVDADAVLGLLPAIDPGPAGGPEPFYYDAATWGSGAFGWRTIHVEGVHSTFSDSPGDYPEKGIVLRFETYLVARDLTVGELAPQSFEVLTGFSWVYHSFAHESYPCDALLPSASSILAALATGLVPGHVGFPGFPGWTPTVGSDLFACPPLSGAPPTVSVAAGGAQGLELNAGLSYATLLYFVLGSTSGTEPGFPLGPYVLPLVVDDAYFQYTVSHPSSPVLPASFGALDQHGHASAAFQLPAGSAPSLVGLVAHHAYVVIDGGVVLQTSNPVAVTIVP